MCVVCFWLCFVEAFEPEGEINKIWTSKESKPKSQVHLWEDVAGFPTACIHSENSDM